VNVSLTTEKAIKVIMQCKRFLEKSVKHGKQITGEERSNAVFADA
jgi:hypothetical protein